MASGGTIPEGWVTAQRGDADALLKIKEGTESWLGTGAKFMLPYFLALQAQIELKLGETGIAMDLLTKAQAKVESTTERWFGPEITRMQGETLLSLGSQRKHAAIERFAEAQAAARAQGARFWELRAVL